MRASAPLSLPREVAVSQVAVTIVTSSSLHRASRNAQVWSVCNCSGCMKERWSR